MSFDTLYEIRASSDGQFYYVVKNPRNGKTLSTSEMYTEKASAIRGATDAGADPHRIADKTGDSE